MNNLLSYCGLIDGEIGASDKDLPVVLSPRSDGLVILVLVLAVVVFSCLILFMLVAAASLALQLPMLPPL